MAEVLSSGGYRVLDEERENTRLAAALTKTDRLDPKAADATVTVLRNFLSIATGYGVNQMRAIGTSALRDAEDGPEFCDRVRKDLKLSIEVISANEEARLAFLSVARAFDISGRKVAVADIGGGSTEIVLASSGLVDQVYETKLGAVRVAEECGVTGRSSDKRVEKLRDFIDRKLKKEVGKPPFVPDMLFGTGGTFTALASIIMAQQGIAGQPMWGFRVSRPQIRHLVADLANMSLERALQGGRPDAAAGRYHRRRPGDHRAHHAAAPRERGAGPHPRRARWPAAHDGAAIADAARRAGRGSPRGRRGVRQELRRRSAPRPAGRPHRRLALAATRRAAGLEAGGPRADRVGRRAGERRLPHQLRRASQAQLPFDRQQRAARLRAPPTADTGERRPLPPRHAGPRSGTRTSPSFRRKTSSA